MLFSDPLIGNIAAIILIILGIALVVFLVSRIGQWLLKLVIGIVVNTVLGLIMLFILNYAFGITFQYTFAEILSVVLFGLPAVGTLLLLKVVGGLTVLVAV